MSPVPEPRHPKDYQVLSALPEKIPVFPLAGILLFPREILPLNVFEPRYLNMINDALAGDRVLGMIQPLEAEAEAQHPALQKVGCAARIISFQETTDNRYLVSLRGICRFTVAEEYDLTPGGYRTVKADYSNFAADLKPSEEAAEMNRTRLLEVVKEYLERNDMDANWDVIHQTPDESLINYFCMVSPFGIQERQALLEAKSVSDRTDMMIALAEMLLARGGEDDVPVH